MSQEAQVPAAESATSAPDANMLAHISMRGNVLGWVGEWLGAPGSGLAIEALLMAPAPPGADPAEPRPEYQLIYKEGLRTPWTLAGQLCGSMGLGLPVCGVRFRLNADAAGLYQCRYDVAFTGGTEARDLSDGEAAIAPAGQAVEALRLVIAPREEPAPLILLNDIDTTRPPAWRDSDRPDDPAIRLRLASPAFPTAPPQILNAEKIPAQARALMNLSFERGVFQERTVPLRIVEGAIVVGEGLAFDPALNLIPGTDNLYSASEVAAGREAARAARGSGAMRHIGGFSQLCTSRAAHNYGHFLVEMFPKAWLGAQLLAHRAPSFLVQDNAMLPVVREALSAIDINPFAVVPIGPDAVECETLVLLDGLTEHGVYQSPLCFQALQSLAAPVPAAPYRKLFIPRHAPHRALTNQEAVEAAMRERGFTIVDPGRYTLVEQIALFKGASLIVGPLGAALTNAAFAPRGARVVALTPQSYPDTFFWFLCQHAGLQYEEVRGIDVAGTPEIEESWNEGFTLSDDDIAYLAAL
ncbi:glycosyltransferase family 61 protein [Acidisoma sp. C75]